MKRIARFPSLLICLSGYLFSFLTVFLLFKLTGKPRDLLTASFVYDLAATFLIFLFWTGLFAFSLQTPEGLK
jgi:hypothetical protein